MVCPGDGRRCVGGGGGLFPGPDGPRFLRALQQTRYAWLSAANFLEIAIVIDNRGVPEQMMDLDLFLAEAGVEIVPVTSGRRGSLATRIAALVEATTPQV